MKIYHIETLGALDGPGIRVVIFLQGCPLKCRYCHNADSWSMTSGETYTVEALYEWVMRYEVYIKLGGGVTFSGGEPLLQAKELLPLILKLKQRGIHVAVDTSGGVYNQDTEILLQTVDLVLLDVKHTDASAYYDLTCGSLAPTLKTLSFLKTHHIPYWIRQVIVTGIHDSESQVKALDRLTYSSDRKKIELKPYKPNGLSKWPASHQHLCLNVDETPDAVMNQMMQLLESD